MDGGGADREGARTREAGRRSLVLRVATWFANLYLAAFALDAVVSLADLVVGQVPLRELATTDPTQYAVRVAIALFLIAASALIPVVLLFVPHLPKLPFVPLVGVVAVDIAYAAARHPHPDAGRAWIDVVEATAVVAALLLIRRRTGAWLLHAARLPRKTHLVARTVLASLVTIVAIPLALSAIVVAAFVVSVERQTGGYLDVTPAGIDLRESVMAKDGRTVHLMAMLHFGEQDFYGTMAGGWPPGSLILAEGVTDRDRRLRGFPSTSRIANALGLAEQPSAGTLAPGAVAHRRRQAATAAPAGDPAPTTPAPAGRSEVVDADIDAAELSDDAVALLHDLGQLYASRSIGDAVLWWRTQVRARRTFTVFTTELIEKRNARLLATFDDEAPSYTNVVIPWGAMHMPGLQAGLERRGYRLEDQRRHTAVRFAALVDRLIGVHSATDEPESSSSAARAGGS